MRPESCMDIPRWQFVKRWYGRIVIDKGGYMREDILAGLQKEIYGRCIKETNKFGIGCYYHIEAVVKNAEILAGQYGADKEVVMIAAWLHDIASITDYSLYGQHHIYGAQMAEDILNGYGYDNERIKLIQRCIRNHRGSISLEKSSVEELCVADADAISHFDNVPGLLYLAFVEKGMGMEEGREFVKSKLIRSYRKLSEDSKKYYSSKFEKVMEVLNTRTTSADLPHD